MSTRQKNRKYARSKRRRNFLFFTVMAVFALLILLDNIFHQSSMYPRAISREQRNLLDIEKYHNKTFTIINIVDGDTLDINCPDNEYQHTRIRLLGIDAPETNSESGIMYFGPEATVFATESSLDKKVDIYLDEGYETRGKYDRLLAYVQLSDGSFLNEIILNEGYAYADTRVRHSFYNKYKQLESRARSNKKGLWQNVTPNQFPQWMQE